MKTHKVFNQAPPRAEVNEYTMNKALIESVDAFGSADMHEELTAIGEHVGTSEYQHDADLANRNTPIHHAFDRWGNRIDEIEFHPAYHKIMRYSIHHGLHTSAWAHPGKGANVKRAAGFILVSQVEPGHGCPVSMTHAAVPALRKSEAVAGFWIPKLFATSYDPELKDPTIKQSAVFGMAMTEKQGGSDVRTNTTYAAENTDSTWSLTGHKWFCSAPQSDAFLVLAQARAKHVGEDEYRSGEALSCFVVPRVLPDGARNSIFVQRLKDKLGNRSNASSEIELENAIGWLVGEVGQGVRTIIEMVNRTRLDCVYGSAAGMRQGVAEAAWHVRHRSSFGSMLIDQPTMTNVIADLQLESEAALWTAMHLAALHDDDQYVAYRRLATAVAKYWVCKRGTNHAYESLECLGGNGYTESFPMARRLREAPVNAVWEGSGNVIALDILRAIQRHPETIESFVKETWLSRGVDSRYDNHFDDMMSLLATAEAEPTAAPRIARHVAESLALTLQSHVLLSAAQPMVADAYLAGRIDTATRGLQYGTLPAFLDVSALAARA